MIDNIGGKIKILAIVISVVGTILSIFIGVILLQGGSYLGLFLLIEGPILSLLSSWILYGFGELINHSKIISKGINRIQVLEVYKNTINNDKVNDEIIQEMQNEILAEYKKYKENEE